MKNKKCFGRIVLVQDEKIIEKYTCPHRFKCKIYNKVTNSKTEIFYFVKMDGHDLRDLITTGKCYIKDLKMFPKKYQFITKDVKNEKRKCKICRSI